MNDKDIMDMQCKIDEGIVLAHRRLLERASLTGQTLVVAREGRIVNFVPDHGAGGNLNVVGDPLARRVGK